MADTDATEAQGADDAQPQGGADQAHGADAQQVQGTSADQAGTGSEPSHAKVAELERDNARYRRRIAELERTQQQTASTTGTELADARGRVTDLEGQLTDMRVQMAAMTVATRLGFKDPEDAYLLLDRSKLELADDGRPRNIEALLKATLDKKPYLGRNLPDLGGGPRGGTPSSTPSMNDLLRAAARGT